MMCPISMTKRRRSLTVALWGETVTSVVPVRNSLRVLRAERGLSQQALANAAGMARQTVSEIERGRLNPSIAHALLLAMALVKCVDDVFYIQRPSTRTGEDGSPSARKR